MRRAPIIILALALTACGAVDQRLADWRHNPGAGVFAARPVPRPAEGLWAILDPGCRKPSVADFGAWPKCASPFWMRGNHAYVVRSTAGRGGRTPDHSYRADYRLSPGDPLIAEVGNQADGYLYLALTKLARDGQGRLVAATGAAFACPGAIGGVIRLRPSANGCESTPAMGVRKAAQATLKDPAALERVAWIAPGAP